MYDINSEKVKSGDECEEMILDWLYSIGYYPKLYRMKDGSAQIKLIDGKRRIYPDIEVFVNQGFVDLKMLVEVKSFKEPVVRPEMYSYWKQGNEIKDKNFGVAIHVKNFLNYLAIWQDTGIPVRIIFVIKSTGDWYWQHVQELNECRVYYENLFRDGENCYFWSLDKLRTDFKGR